jgi:TPR repeat protein
MRASQYQKGRYDLPQDFEKAFQLYSRAAEFGLAFVHYEIGLIYDAGEYVERDLKKSLYHWKRAVISGDPTARHNLGVYEYNRGKTIREMKHFMITISDGSKDYLETVHGLCEAGEVCKADYELGVSSFQA